MALSYLKGLDGPFLFYSSLMDFFLNIPQEDSNIGEVFFALLGRVFFV